jgi:Tetratricopeptide repeat
VRLAARPVFLAGREELLGELDARLSAGDGRWPRLVALCGLGGAGKTSVAAEYAYRHLAEVGAAWQFAADDPAVLAAGFGELAAQLGARDVLDTRDPVASVHGVLAAYRREWLLVFDNAADRTSIEAFLPPAGRGRILVTSQNQNWPAGHALDVPVLDTEVAAGFLVNRTGNPDRRAAAELAVELGGLPLALEQAAAYMQATGDSLADYLASFRQRRPDMMGRGEPTGYGKTVATTWSLAFERLQQASPGAVGLLRLLAFCAPEAVPQRLLLRPRPGFGEPLGHEVAPVLGPLLEDPLAIKDALADLRRYSLISPAVDGSVSVHRLVQAVTLDQMPEKLAAAWRHAAGVLIEAALPTDPRQPVTWPTCAALLPHTQAALASHARGLSVIADYLGYIGNYAAARALHQQVVEAREEVLGPEHPLTLTARASLARWAGQAGDATGARDQFAALLPVVGQCLGPEHSQTLTVRGSLARWAGQAGDAAGARDQFAALLPVRERVFGPDHPETLATRASLAGWTAEAGDAAGARDQFAALLPVVGQCLGPEHSQTLTVRGSLARWAGQAGDAAGARDQFAALLPVRERVFGPDHPETLATRASLAGWSGEAGDATVARDQFAALLPVVERVFGPEHPETLNARAGLAGWTGEAGDATVARDQFAALLPVVERVFGPEHPETLNARTSLARWAGQAGDAAGARDQFAALLPLRNRVFGPDHPETLAVRASLAGWTGEAGDATVARDQFAALLPVVERVFGPEHPETLNARASLAYWTRRSRPRNRTRKST